MQITQAFQSPRPLRDGTGQHWTSYRMLAISIHPPLAGRDGMSILIKDIFGKISIHPPLAGRDRLRARQHEQDGISIHPPLAGRDIRFGYALGYVIEFQSTRPLRDGTRGTYTVGEITEISIHPPLAGRDGAQRRQNVTRQNFNPPAPCGTGRRPDGGDDARMVFQSTRPLRDGTREA